MANREKNMASDKEWWDKYQKLQTARDSAYAEEMKRSANIPGSLPQGYINEYGDPVRGQVEPRFSNKGTIYYSGKRPQGSGKLTLLEYIPEEYTNALSVRFKKGLLQRDPRNKKDIIRAQEYLFKIGYLDNIKEIDGVMGPKTRGAIRRLESNVPSPTERVMNWLKKL